MAIRKNRDHTLRHGIIIGAMLVDGMGAVDVNDSAGKVSALQGYLVYLKDYRVGR